MGVESVCELLDFDLEGEKVEGETICRRLNAALVPGVRVLQCYDGGRKLRDLALLRCALGLEYDQGIPQEAQGAIAALLARESLPMEKKSKKGTVEQDIRPMILEAAVRQAGEKELSLEVLITCQNPSLNPTLISGAITKYLPEFAPDFVTYRREEIYDQEKNIFR